MLCVFEVVATSLLLKLMFQLLDLVFRSGRGDVLIAKQILCFLVYLHCLLSFSLYWMCKKKKNTVRKQNAQVSTSQFGQRNPLLMVIMHEKNFS